VPLVRGFSRSRPEKDIILDAQRLIENGYKEIVFDRDMPWLFWKRFKAKTALVDLIDRLEKYRWSFTHKAEFHRSR